MDDMDACTAEWQSRSAAAAIATGSRQKANFDGAVQLYKRHVGSASASKSKPPLVACVWLSLKACMCS